MTVTPKLSKFRSILPSTRPLADALDRLRYQPVEGPHGELEVLLLRVLELGVRQAAQALDEEHHGGHTRAGDLGRVVQGPARKPMRRAGDLPDRLVGELDQLVVEQDRLDVPDALPLNLDVLLARKTPRGGLGVAQHLRELHRVEVALVEQALRGLDYGRDDAGLRDDPAHRADR